MDNLQEMLGKYSYQPLAAQMLDLPERELYDAVPNPGVEVVVVFSTLIIVETMEKWNVPTAQMNEAITKMEESNPFSTVELLKSTIVYIAVYCFIGLILAAIFKSKSTQQE